MKKLTREHQKRFTELINSDMGILIYKGDGGYIIQNWGDDGLEMVDVLINILTKDNLIPDHLTKNDRLETAQRHESLKKLLLDFAINTYARMGDEFRSFCSQALKEYKKSCTGKGE